MRWNMRHVVYITGQRYVRVHPYYIILLSGRMTTCLSDWMSGWLNGCLAEWMTDEFTS